MPKFQNFPKITELADDDLLLAFQESSQSVKTITKENAALSISQSNAIQLATIAALRAFDVTTLGENRSAYVSGYNTSTDGAGGNFVYFPYSVVADNNGTIIAPSSGQGRWMRSWFGEVNVRWFGTYGDGTHNDTVALQSAIDFAEALHTANQLPITVRMPSGTYKVSATITLTVDGVSLMGDGMKSSIFYRDTDFGTTLHVTGGYQGGTNVKGLGFLADPDVTVTQGSHVIIQQLAGGVISDLWIQDGFIGMTMQGCYDIFFDNIRIWGGQNLAGPNTTGSKYLYVPTNGNPANPTFDTIFTNFMFRHSSAGSEKYVAIGIDIAQADGIWFADGHVIGANFELQIAPPSTYTVQNVQFTDVFFDGNCQCGAQLTGAGTIAGVRFGSNVVFGGADGTANADAVVVNCALLNGLVFEGVEWGSNRAAALNLIDGDNIFVKGCVFKDNNLASVSNVLSVQAGTTHVEITNCSFGYQPAGYAIFVNGGSNTWILGCSFYGIGGPDDIALNSIGLAFRCAGCISSRSGQAPVASAAVPAIPQIGEVFYISGTTGITGLPSSYFNRQITLSFQASLTMTNSATLKLAGGANFSATVDDQITLTCIGGNTWAEASRSVN